MRQLHAIGRREIGIIGGDGKRDVGLYRARQKMRGRIEPGIERLAALGRDGKYVIGLAVLALAAGINHRGTATVATPPQVLQTIGLVDGELANVAALLGRHRARWLLLPGCLAIEAHGVIGWGINPTIDEAAALDVLREVDLADHPLALVVIAKFKATLCLPLVAGGRRLVGRKHLSGMIGGKRGERGQGKRNGEGEEGLAHDGSGWKKGSDTTVNAGRARRLESS